MMTKSVLKEETDTSMITLPTGDGTNKITNWKIGTSPLSCGLLVLQGWSEGIGIQSNKDDFENKLFLLTYYSKNRDIYEKSKSPQWGSRALGGETLAPIGVGRTCFQFLSKDRNYILSSTKEWIARFQEFVKKYGLGDFSVTNVVTNPSYRQHQIQVALWKWNGEAPPAKEFKNV